MNCEELVKALLSASTVSTAWGRLMQDAAAAIEALQAEAKRLQERLCDWCMVCPKERRKPEDCELLSE